MMADSYEAERGVGMVTEWHNSMDNPGIEVCRSRLDLHTSTLDLHRSRLDVCRSKVIHTNLRFLAL